MTGLETVMHLPILVNGKNEKYIPEIKVSLSFHVESLVLMTRVNEK
jgi:hypothetical protein